MRILVVSDYPDTLQNLKKGLVNFGHSVVTARNELQALQILTNGGDGVKSVDVVITKFDDTSSESLSVIQFAKKINPSLLTIFFAQKGGEGPAEIQLLDDCKCIPGTFSPENLVEVIEDIAEGFQAEHVN